MHTELLKRRERQLKAKYDKGYRAYVMEACRLDPVLWINDWCWTFDPRNAARGLPTLVPFKLFARQEEYIRWRRERLALREFGSVPKARDSGISYLNCADHAHHFLFGEGYVGGMASRKEILVDRLGDPGSLFEKVRSILKTLPYWMKPEPKNFVNGYMKMLNLERGNAITGEAGLNIGRGNRYLLLDLDEAAFLENQESVAAAVSQSADCVIKTSTPNGAGNLFAQDCNSATHQTFYFRWTSDDRKNKWVMPDGTTGNGPDAPIGAVYPWYEDQKMKLSPITIAQEIDINFNASIEGIVIRPEWVQAAINYPLIMTNFIRQAGLDIATEGKDLSVFTIVDGQNKVVFIDSWQGQNTTETAHRAIALCHQHNVNVLNFDVVGVGAGVSGVLQTTPGLRFKYNPINGGSAPSLLHWPAENRSSKDKFHNRRAEIYYLAAQRFKKTWENRQGIANHPTDECISIPDHPKLISHLSLTTAKHTDTGKILLVSKKDMPVSPDFADCLVYALIPEATPLYGASVAKWG